MRFPVMAAALALLVPLQDVDPALEPYLTKEKLSGEIAIWGSDTLLNMVTYWIEGLKKHHPDINIQCERKCSEFLHQDSLAGLTTGTLQIVPMSRLARPAEIEAFRAAKEYPPTEIRIGLEAHCIIVHKDNPLDSLTLEQADAVFSMNRRRGAGNDMRIWGGLGLAGDWSTLPIALYGRNSASATHAFFRDRVLKGGSFKEEIKEQPASASVVVAVADDKSAIGYVGTGYATPGVKKLRISEKAGAPGVAADPARVLDGSYPLSRWLYLYIDRAPAKAVHPIVREFCRYALSREGQEVVRKDALIPIPARIAREEAKKLE